MGRSSCSVYIFASTPMGRAPAFCSLRNIKDSNQNSVYFALGLPLSLVPSPFWRVGMALYLTITWEWQVREWEPGMKEGSESWTTVRNAHLPTTVQSRTQCPQACGPAQHASCILQGLTAHGLGWEAKEYAQGAVQGGNSQPPKGGGQPRRVGVLGGIASSESQARPFAGTGCAVPGLRETPLGQRQGDGAGAGQQSAGRALTDDPS